MKLPFYERWSTFFLLSLVMIASSIFIFWDLSDWEANPNRSISMPWLGVLLYKIGGKWLLSAMILAVGIMLLVTGIRRRRIQLLMRQADQQEK